MLMWRLFFEALNLVRAVLGPGHPRVLYFAFGANLDPKVLAKRKIKIFSAREFELRDFALRFSHQGLYRGMGFASIEASPGTVTYGLLYEISRLDALRLDLYEGVWFINRYRRVRQHQDGINLYFYQSRSPRVGLKPTDDYLSKMLRGFALLENVPREFLEWLKNHDTVKNLSVSDDVGFCFRVPNTWPKPLIKVLRKYDQFVVSLFANYIRDWSPSAHLIRHEDFERSHIITSNGDRQNEVFHVVALHREPCASRDIAALTKLANALESYKAIPEVAAFHQDLITHLGGEKPIFESSRAVNVSGKSGIMLGLFAAPYNKDLGLECIVYGECSIPPAIAKAFPSVGRPVMVRRYSKGFNSDFSVAIFPENFADAGVIPMDARSFYFIDKFVDRCRRITIPFVKNKTTINSLRSLKTATDEQLKEVASLWVFLHEHFHRQGALPLPQALTLKSSKSTAGLEELRVDLLAMLACRSEIVRKNCNATLLEEFVLAERLFRYGIERCPNADYDSRGAHVFYRYLEKNGLVLDQDALLDVDMVRFRRLARRLSHDIQMLEEQTVSLPFVKAKARLSGYVKNVARFDEVAKVFPRAKFYVGSKWQ
ncbi:MAG: DUF6421 family protein [Oligoflexales bacterium]